VEVGEGVGIDGNGEFDCSGEFVADGKLEEVDERAGDCEEEIDDVVEGLCCAENEAASVARDVPLAPGLDVVYELWTAVTEARPDSVCSEETDTDGEAAGLRVEDLEKYALEDEEVVAREEDVNCEALLVDERLLNIVIPGLKLTRALRLGERLLKGDTDAAADKLIVGVSCPDTVVPGEDDSLRMDDEDKEPD